MKLILFDIDGTLLLTGGAGKVAFERAFEELFGIPDCWGDVVPDGKTDPIIFDEIVSRALCRPLTAAEKLSLNKKYLDYFRDAVKESPRFRVLPGVPQLLERLSSHPGAGLGIVTGNFEDSGRKKLERAGIAHHFRFGGFGSDSADRVEITRRAIERGEALLGPVARRDIFVVGDTPHDIRAAKACGVRSVAVGTGSMDRKILAPFEPDYLFDDLSDARVFLDAVTSG